MKTIMKMTVLVVLPSGIASCKNSSHTTSDSKAVIYTCPMHPEVTSELADSKCPKCGMDLVKKKL
jgi:hypothetical protein